MNVYFLDYENTKAYLTFWEKCMSGKSMVLEFLPQNLIGQSDCWTLQRRISVDWHNLMVI